MAALSITVAEVIPGTTGATFEDGLAGATITAGQPLYLDASVGTYKLADADASAATAQVRGIALHGALTGQPIKMQTGGDITLGATAAPAVGVIYALGATAGSIVPSADLANPVRVSILGVGKSTGVVALKLNNTGIVKA
jgi:hypothetical protein